MKKKYISIGKNNNNLNSIVEKEVDQPKNDKEKDKFLNVFSTSMELGFSISLPIVIGVMLGAYLDTILNTSPKLTLSLLFTGIIIGCSNIYKIYKDS